MHSLVLSFHTTYKEVWATYYTSHGTRGELLGKFWVIPVMGKATLAKQQGTIMIHNILLYTTACVRHK